MRVVCGPHRRVRARWTKSPTCTGSWIRRAPGIPTGTGASGAYSRHTRTGARLDRGGRAICWAHRLTGQATASEPGVPRVSQMGRAFDPRRFRWPAPWAALTTESDPLAFWRQLFPGVAPTVREELPREVGSRHPLAGVDCRPVAYNRMGCKDYLFLTNRADMPVVAVHFTWGREADPAWPAVQIYPNLREFVRRRRNWGEEIRQAARNWWHRIK